MTTPQPAQPADESLDSRLKQLTPEQRALLILRLNKKLQSRADADLPLRVYARDGRTPLSFAQRRLWIVDQIEPGTNVNNITSAFRLTGALLVPALRATMQEIVRRHEVLRTTFKSADGEPLQHISPFPVLPFEEISLEAHQKDLQDETIEEICRAEANAPFDLAAGPLIRAVLIRLAPAEHVLVIAVHHIVSDGWSVNVFANEFAHIYEAFRMGRPSPLPALEIQYADFTLWQRERLHRGLFSPQIDYWKRQLADLTPLHLPEDSGPPVMPGNRGDNIPFAVGHSLAVELKMLAGSEGATLFMVLLAAFDLLLSRYAGAPDVAVGTVTANRTEAKLEPLVGFFVNTLVLRTDLTGPLTFRELVGRVKTTVLEAQQNQDVPFEILLDELSPARGANRSAFFQSVFVFQNTAPTKLAIPGLEVAALESDNAAPKFDLMLAAKETPDGIAGVFSFDCDIFGRPFIARLSSHFETVLQAIAANPDLDIAEVPLMPAAAREKLIREWAGETFALPEGTITEHLESQVRKTPFAVALRCGDQKWTYQQLHERSNQLAHVLVSRGVGPEVRVGMCLQRSEHIIFTFLAILKAGGVYVPLDPDYPDDRLAYMLRDSAPAVLVTESSFVNRFQRSPAQVLNLETEQRRIDTFGADPLPVEITGRNAAYMLYTSGSTGRPKGVVTEHRSTLALLDWATRTYSLDELSAVLFSTSVSFDASIFEILAPLACGGCVAVAPTLLQWEGEKASLIAAVPSVVAEWCKSSSDRNFPSVLNLGGEAVPKWLAERLCSGNHGRVMNLYGPTECTTYSTFAELTGEQTPNIGRPLRNYQVYLLNESRDPVPVGVPGELYIGGAGVGRGYWQRPELTAERFVPDPFSDVPGARLYRTGDLARWDNDGAIQYLGRMDHQVKFNGCRIEPGEIETVLCSHPLVDQAAVSVREDRLGDKRLVAYWTRSNNCVEPHPQALREFLQTRLPASMLPSAFVEMPQLPRSANGKLDRRALPPPPPEVQLPSRVPIDEWERALVEIWEEVLGLSGVGVSQDFFAAGGNSLKAILLATRISRQFQCPLPVRVIFECPTVEQQAAFLRDSASLALAPSLVSLQKSSSESPLFCIHPQFGFAHCYLELARLLGSDLPVYGLQAQGIDAGQPLIPTIPEMATLYLQSIRSVQPHGPYRLAGWSMGSAIAYEIACQLLDAGESISLLVFMDGRPLMNEKMPLQLRLLNRESQLEKIAEEYLVHFAVDAGIPEDEIRKLPQNQRAACYLESANGRGKFPVALSADSFEQALRVIASNRLAVAAYRPSPRQLAAVLIRVPLIAEEHSDYGWGQFALAGLDVIEVDSTHDDLLSTPAVVAVAAALKPYLEQSKSVFADANCEAATVGASA